MTSNFKKHFALSLILIIGIGIIYMLKEYVTPILSAVILSFLLYPLYQYTLKKTKNELTASMLIFLSIFLIIIVPISIISSVVLNHINDINFSEDTLVKYENSLYELTGKKIMISEGLINVEQNLKSDLRTTLPKLMSYTSHFFLSIFIMFYIMFYLFTEKHKFLENVISMLPFSQKNSEYLLDESGKVVRAVFLGQLITAVIQGLLGMFAFILVGAPNAIFWGIIMIFLSIIPTIGAFLVWIPVGLILIFNGHLWGGIFILLWGAVVVSQIDNFVRPKLVNRFADIHPIETFLGIFMGIATFGFIGIIIGPLIMSLFSTLIKVFRQEYSIDK